MCLEETAWIKISVKLFKQKEPIKEEDQRQKYFFLNCKG